MKIGLMAQPKLSALAGVLLFLPFVCLNLIVGNRIEPFFSLIRPGLHTSPLEVVLLAAAILLIPIGGLMALRPVGQMGADGKRTLYLLNGLLGAALLGVFVLLVVVLGMEIYRCEVLQIPNCD